MKRDSLVDVLASRARSLAEGDTAHMTRDGIRTKIGEPLPCGLVVFF